ncbi:MAG: ATP-binding protein [Candidatus Acidiferrales bacterium]
MIHINSLRFRMMLLFCAIVGIFLAGTLFGIYGLFSREMLSQLDCRLLRVGSTVVAQVVSDPTKPHIENLDVPKEYFEVLDSSGNVLEQSKNLYGHAIGLGGELDLSRVLFRTTEDAEQGRQRLALIPFKQVSEQRVLVITMPMSHDDMALGTIRRLILWVLPISLLLTAGISVWYVGRSLEPVTKLIEQARRMMEGIQGSSPPEPELESEDQRLLSVPDAHDELSSLASAFNLLFTRLSVALRQDRQFVSDAAHELRTPLHVLRGETELVLSQVRSTEEYVKTLYVVNEEVSSLTRIVEALFTLSMADAGQLRMNCEPLYLNEVMEQACTRIGPLAQAKRIRIERDLSEDIAYFGDETLLQELSIIFLDNAIKYSPPDTLVRVNLERDHGRLRLKFRDQGYGIPREHLPHIFERFYRARVPESSETRSGGLGLAIAQAIVHAQGGSIECESTPASHTTFTVILKDAAQWDSSPVASSSLGTAGYREPRLESGIAVGS